MARVIRPSIPVLSAGWILAGLLALMLPIQSPAQPPPTINLNLPSEAAGGGTLAVRLAFPTQAVGPRYADGAPIIVFVPGGHSFGGLSGGFSFAGQGFVAVTFLFPGGADGSFHSDGDFDYRGANCIAALRDVLKFAGGRLTDNLGRRISQLLPLPVLTEMVGMNGSSNGGPISMAVLATYGSELDFVKTYVGWENPTGGQTVVIEAGGKSYDCNPNRDGDGNGIPTDDGKNPYLTTYSASTLGMEFDRLAYDPAYSWTVNDPAGLHPPAQHEGALFLDGNGNGVLDYIPGAVNCFDLDGDGMIDSGDDYMFFPLVGYETGNMLLHYSVEVLGEADRRHLYGPSWPADVATPAQTEAYWARRDATRFYDSLPATHPGLHCLLAFASEDHVQAADEHPHIQQAYDGFWRNGFWCRLNPDESYYRLLVPSPDPAPMDADANSPVVWPDMAGFDEPIGLSSQTASLAGVMEMADRARAGNWEANLIGPVADVEGGPDAEESLGSGPFVSGWTHAASEHLEVRIAPNPIGSQSQISWHWLRPDSPGRSWIITLSDAAGRRCADLRLTGEVRSIPMDALRRQCRHLAPGIYWVTIRTDGARVVLPAVFTR